MKELGENSNLNNILEITWFVIWFTSFFLSFVIFLVLKKRRSSIITDTNFITVRKTISTTIIVFVIYYFIIYGFFEWQFRWAYLSCVFGISFFLILDRFLIGFKYNRKNSNQNLWGIKLYWFSITYTTLRGLSIISFIAMNIFLTQMFVGLYFSYLIIFSVPEMYTFNLKNYITHNNSSPDTTTVYGNFLGIDDWLNRKIEPINPNKNHNLNFNELIFEPKSFGLGIYIKKGFIFKKYLFSTIYAKGDLYYSTNYDTLYIGQSNYYIPQNYITKIKNKYIHTITKQKSNILNLSYNEKEKLTIQNYPEYYETFNRVIE